jgi:hypothetical protein
MAQPTSRRSTSHWLKVEDHFDQFAAVVENDVFIGEVQ